MIHTHLKETARCTSTNFSTIGYKCLGDNVTARLLHIWVTLIEKKNHITSKWKKWSIRHLQLNEWPMRKEVKKYHNITM